MKRYCMGRLSLKQAYRFYKVAEYFGRLLFVFMFFITSIPVYFPPDIGCLYATARGIILEV